MEQHIDAKQGLLDCAMGREEEQRSALSFGLTLDKCRCHHTDRQTDKHKSENKATVSLNLESDSNINIINIFHKHHKRLSSSKFEMYTNTITVCNFLPFEIQIIWVGGSIINGISKRVVAWIGLIGLIWAGRSDAMWWLFGGDLKIGFVWDEKTAPPIMA